MFGFLNRKESRQQSSPRTRNTDDFLVSIRNNPEVFARLEHERTHKPTEEIMKEIQFGLRLSNVIGDTTFTAEKGIVVIPPKYELWLYFLLAVRLAVLGYQVIFLHHNWSNALMRSLRPALSYLKYQNLHIENLEDYVWPVNSGALMLNFADTLKGGQKCLPSFSTAIVESKADLDYVMAYILMNAFTFAGMKRSNIKRIIIDERIRREFETKILSRLDALERVNTARITSDRVKKQIQEIVSEGISEGADLITGGDNFEVDHYGNIILTNVTPDMRVYQKSFYGPVLLLSYTSMEPRTLRKMVKQQPSRGIVVFTEDKNFMDMHRVCFKDKEVVERPMSGTVGKIAGIMEYNPALEAMCKILGIKV